jgi:hypothetical protein
LSNAALHCGPITGTVLCCTTPVVGASSEFATVVAAGDGAGCTAAGCGVGRGVGRGVGGGGVAGTNGGVPGHTVYQKTPFVDENALHTLESSSNHA